MKLHFSLSTIRLLIGTTALTFLVHSLSAQSPATPTWQDLKQSGANYNDVKAAFLRQNESRLPRAIRELTKEVSRSERKSDKFERELEGIVQFKRWSEFVEPRVAESNGDLSVINEGNVRALAQQANLLQSRAATWQLVGPRNTATNGGNGRVNGIKVHPTNSNLLFASTPAGGLWKSSNGGTSWTAITDAIAVLGATDVAFDPTNPDIMYLATGDGDAGDTRSTGIYKSTDGGTTWVATGLNFTLSQGTTLSKILVHPTNNQILLTAGNTGIRRSTDAGATWTQVSTASIKDIEWKPNNPLVVYAGGYSGSAGVWRSTDGGITWTKLTATPLPSTGTQRVAIGVSPHDAEYVYALFAKSTGYGFQGMYRSTDGGTTWTQQATTPNMLGWQANGSDTDGQGWYDLAIAVSPTDKNMVMIGGVNIWKSMDGGVNWTCKAHWSGNGAPYVHADQHDFTFSGSTFYAGNDGGVFKSTDGGTTWTNISSTLSNAQLYGLGLSSGNANLILSGHQDNGTNLTSNGTTWAQVLGGDGMLCFIDRTNDSRMFASIYNGALYRSTNGGASFGNLTTITNGGWVTPWLQDPVSPATLYAAGSEINKSTDYGTNWTAISSFGGTTSFKAMDVAKTNPLCIIAATSTSVRKTINGGTSWTTLTGLPTSGILTVHFNVNDANKIYVGVASYQGSSVWYSTDGGATWVNWGTGLPSVPVSCFVTQLGTDGSMYCGTDIGVYYRNNTSTGWTAFTQGMPGIPVRDLEIYYPTQKLRAATYGRGIWESNLEVAVNGFSIVASANPVTGGTVTGTGFFPSGQSVTLTATPNTGWTFVNWTENGTAVSTNATLTFNATTNRTLQANFTGGPLPACGNTTLTNCSGTITDGSGALNYEHGLLCTWLIRPTTPPSALVLNFTAFATEAGYDFVKVYDGTSASGALLGSFSGLSIPPRVVASSGAMFIEFSSDADLADAGWSATYSCSSGTFYNLTLTANPVAGGTVLGAGSYLSGDSVTVSATANVNYLFTNWTDSLTGAIVSNNAVYGFRMTAARKLIANFRVSGCVGLTTYTTCNGTVEDGSGANSYNNNLNCTWLIQPSTPATTLILNFTTFSTESSYDFVKVYDGTSANGRLLGSFSGANLPPRLIATSGAIFIQFTTDGSGTYNGWSANWICSNATLYNITATVNPALSGTVIGAGAYLAGETATLVATPNAGYLFTNWTDSITGAVLGTLDTYRLSVAANRRLIANFRVNGCAGLTTYNNCSGTVEDGSGSSMYLNGLNCSWLIQPTTPPTYLLLNFTAFQTESGYDYVTIYDGTSASGRLLGRYSGTTLPTRLIATSGALFITFTTDGSSVFQGWSANYTCFNGAAYNVTATANPAALGATSGSGVYFMGDSATVVAFAAANGVFVNWTDSTGTIVSTNVTYTFRVTANRRLTANFRLDGCQGGLIYNTCSGTVTDGSTANYANSLNCTWLIQPSPAATRITLHFTAFETEASFDSVAVYDGTNATGRFLGKFSGTTLPSDLVATSGSMFIRFTTDGGVTYAGWSADWTCASAIPTYTLTLNANPVAGGTVIGGGSYTSGQNVRARAIPAAGWNFVNWTESGNIVSSDTGYSFNLMGNRTLTANFAQVQMATVSTISFPLAGGTTSGGGAYAVGQSVTLTATAASQFVFEKWTENSVTVSTNRIYTFTASANRTLTAVFKGILNSDWDVTPTSENHTLIVPLNANVQLGNGGLQNGDYVGVFYTDSNRLKCAGRQVWNGASTSVTAYGNDLGVGKNGFGLNERFTWRVFRPSVRMQYDVDPAYLPIAGIYTHQGNYARDGISGLAGLTAQIGDTLHLDQGWNMVGIYIHPADSTLTTMLAPITNQLILMKTVDGRTYIPSTGINTIQNWNVKEGYRIKMAQAADVVLYGRRIDPMAIQIPFTAGWSIIPYVRTTPMLFPTVFAGNTAQIDLAKDNLGQTWVPSLSINNIGNTIVNQAYKVKFNTSGVLSQPANRRGDDPIDNPSPARYFEVSKQPTGEDATIILTQSILKDVLQMGDEVGVFNATGLLCGSVVWRGENTAIAVKGDDAFTAPQEGMKMGDNYQLHVKRHGFDLPIRLNVTFENPNQAHYAADNISRLTKASLPSMPVLPFAEKAFAYPNPVGTELTIQLESDDANAMITLYDVMGNILQLNTEQRIVGKTQVWKFDTSNLANGAYLYTVKTVNKTHNGTYMIQH
jgi:CUB domain/Divergent InlB B-repeat domain/Secretion system C-terminal sorting domain